MLSQKDDRIWAMLCHLGIFSGNIIPFGNLIVPLVIWLIKKDESAFVDHHGKEALNFQISMIIYLIISGILAIILIGFVFMIFLWIANLILAVVATLRASGGEWYRYPMTIRFIN